MKPAPYRAFDFPGRPSRAMALDAIRAALADEGIALGTPGQAQAIRMVITGDGIMRVFVPSSLLVPA